MPDVAAESDVADAQLQERMQARMDSTLDEAAQAELNTNLQRGDAKKATDGAPVDAAAGVKNARHAAAAILRERGFDRSDLERLNGLGRLCSRP